jgi:hypothetical protein
MFTWLNKLGVRGDTGFVVQRTGRFDMEYRDHGKIIKMYVEDGFSGGLPCICVNPDAFERWDGDLPSSRITKEEQAKMFNNLKEALEFQGLKTVVTQRKVGP